MNSKKLDCVSKFIFHPLVYSFLRYYWHNVWDKWEISDNFWEPRVSGILWLILTKCYVSANFMFGGLDKRLGLVLQTPTGCF